MGRYFCAQLRCWECSLSSPPLPVPLILYILWCPVQAKFASLCQSGEPRNCCSNKCP